MQNIIESKLNGEGLRVGIVISRFNDFITSRLLDGAIDCFVRHGVEQKEIDVAWVPGAFEIPLVQKKMCLSKKYDVVICLGAVIRDSKVIIPNSQSKILENDKILVFLKPQYISKVENIFH